MSARVSVYDLDVCACCGALGPNMPRCAWKHQKEVSIPVTDLREGDRVKMSPYLYYAVQMVTWSKDGRTLFYRLRDQQTPRTITLDSDFMPTFVGLRIAPCDAACCELCAIERDELVHYCRDHWFSWSVAA